MLPKIITVSIALDSGIDVSPAIIIIIIYLFTADKKSFT